MAKANLLPFCERRSRADNDDAGEPPGDGAALGARFELGIGQDAELGEHAGVGIERMAGEEEADRLELVLQALHRRPGLHSARMSDLRPRRAAAARTDRRCPAPRSPPARLAKASICSTLPCTSARLGSRAVEGAGGARRLQRALVERLGVAAAGEVGEVA